MSSTFAVTTIDTGHEDMIHDAQMDFLGTRLATCSCDKSIRLFDVNLTTGSQNFVTDLKGHEGPVWQLAWAHPRFGNLLASCSYDRRVIIWKERENGKWENEYTYEGHDSSGNTWMNLGGFLVSLLGQDHKTNCVCWAPPEWGLMLACGSSDSSITVLSCIENRWVSTKIPNAHTLGCNAVSWAPATSAAGSGSSDVQMVRRFVSGGCDNLVKIWKEENEQWVEDVKLEGHSDWVRDVAWSPSAGVTRMKIASSSQDRRVIIWNNNDGGAWVPEALHVFEDVVWHVSWNFVGDVLAVSGGDNQVSLWKKQESGNWECISDSAKTQQQQQQQIDHRTL